MYQWNLRVACLDKPIYIYITTNTYTYIYIRHVPAMQSKPSNDEHQQKQVWYLIGEFRGPHIEVWYLWTLEVEFFHLKEMISRLTSG
jgi:hypothetical protein